MHTHTVVAMMLMLMLMLIVMGLEMVMLPPGEEEEEEQPGTGKRIQWAMSGLVRLRTAMQCMVRTAAVPVRMEMDVTAVTFPAELNRSVEGSNSESKKSGHEPADEMLVAVCLC